MAKPIIEVGETVPGNLKFGIIVAVALFWAEFFRALLEDLFKGVLAPYPIATADFFTAILASVLGYAILLFYRKITWRLKKVKV